MPISGTRDADLTALYRDTLAAIRDALDIPIPATGEREEQMFRRLQRDRVIAVIGSIDAILDNGHAPDIITGVLRGRTRQLPITYRRYIGTAKDHPADCIVCGPGCCSPVLGVHASCPGPLVGRTVESVR